MRSVTFFVVQMTSFCVCPFFDFVFVPVTFFRAWSSCVRGKGEERGGTNRSQKMGRHENKIFLSDECSLIGVERNVYPMTPANNSLQ